MEEEKKEGGDRLREQERKKNLIVHRSHQVSPRTGNTPLLLLRSYLFISQLALLFLHLLQLKKEEEEEKKKEKNCPPTEERREKSNQDLQKKRFSLGRARESKRAI